MHAHHLFSRTFRNRRARLHGLRPCVQPSSCCVSEPTRSLSATRNSCVRALSGSDSGAALLIQAGCVGSGVRLVGDVLAAVDHEYVAQANVHTPRPSRVKRAMVASTHRPATKDIDEVEVGCSSTRWVRLMAACSFVLPAAFARAEETCVFSGKTDYGGRLRIVAVSKEIGGRTDIDARLELNATPLPLIHTRYVRGA